MDFIPPNMFDFNLDILPALINFIDYGSNSSYIWLETMIYNFNKVFRVIWQNKDFKTYLADQGHQKIYELADFMMMTLQTLFFRLCKDTSKASTQTNKQTDKQAIKEHFDFM